MSQAGIPEDYVPLARSEYIRAFRKAPEGTKSCPFCYGTDLSIYREPCTFMSDYVCIECNTCHAHGPTRGFDDQYNHEYTWNHRAGVL